MFPFETTESDKKKNYLQHQMIIPGNDKMNVKMETYQSHAHAADLDCFQVWRTHHYCWLMEHVVVVAEVDEMNMLLRDWIQQTSPSGYWNMEVLRVNS